MFERILFPTDFSEPSMKVLGYIPALKEAGTREVVLVHVIDQKEITLIAMGGQGFLGTVPDQETETQRQLREEIQHRILDVRRALEKHGVKVTVRTPVGSPGKEIVAAADAEGASLIVLGSHGRSNIRDRLLGTVSEYVIKNANQPVLVIKRDRVVGS
ncbi:MULTISPECIES: universal stress protein [unclassified Methanoculleus]|uniref:universal stress protein n=1 Tax=unclassified Methanoculleus TaxID=2619537 RepID=UPI0025EADCE8|nr:MULTISPECIES: universal stress protein [unclassified Methanoculleus]MDD2253706.1 universal stress protein [Methanoculleus sp.]MDD2788160.1 universal stress protein [Methanoculleus sp.]MDD3216979.1 universal stress protein [Methanoculleus sp.]MDD4314493.1 universal stress protein [Methanoculleus sp.]MDD4470730.1 universal stress protein [Methanoculleus sp.]